MVASHAVGALKKKGGRKKSTTGLRGSLEERRYRKRLPFWRAMGKRFNECGGKRLTRPLVIISHEKGKRVFVTTP